MKLKILALKIFAKMKVSTILGKMCVIYFSFLIVEHKNLYGEKLMPFAECPIAVFSGDGRQWDIIIYKTIAIIFHWTFGERY